MTVKSSISLTDQQAAFARKLVKEGRYSSLSAVLQQGLEMLREKSEAHDVEMAALRRLLEERQKGPFIRLEEMDVRVSKMIERKRQEHNL